MPGIVGLITKKPREWAEPQLRSMIEAVRHESFYEAVTWIDEALGIYAGWIGRKNSSAGVLPYRNERGNVALLFAGEEFPDPNLVSKLKSQGHDVQGSGSSYLVHVYEDDPSFPASLNGRFQGLLGDSSRGTAMLFNDRFGMHKLYYHESQEAFYFGAEAKAILKVRPELRKVDPRGAAEMVIGGCVLENRSLFDGIYTLPLGSRWVFERGALVNKGAYFQPRDWEEQERLDPETYYQQLRETFAHTLPRYFEGSERIGLALTGGLDTRMIMAWLQMPQGSLPCYTFGGMYRDCQDVVVARRVADLCGQAHEVIPVEKEFLDNFGHYAERSVFLTDGTVPVRCSPDLYVQEKARHIAPIRISGTYGSEVLRGLGGSKPANLLPGLFQPEMEAETARSKERLAAIRKVHPVSFSVFHQTPMRGVDTLEQTQLAVRSPYLDNDVVRLAFQAPDIRLTRSDIFANNDVCNRLIADGDAQLRGIRTDRGLAGQGGWRDAMVKRVLEFTFYAEYAYDYGMPPWLAKIDHVLSPLHLERLFLGRHKFYHYRVWYRDPLAKYVREILLDPRTLSRPYLDRKSVEAVVHGHLKGGRNFTMEIHQLLTLELIHRTLVDHA